MRTGELQRIRRHLQSTRAFEHQAYRDLGHPLAARRSRCATTSASSACSRSFRPSPTPFTDRDAKALRLLGGLMGAALGHAAAYEARQARLEERTRALQESEQRFKQLVDVAQEGIWVADEHGIITYVNQRMADLLGYQNGAMLGRPVYDFIDAASRAGAQRALAGGRARAGRARTSASAAATAPSSGAWSPSSPILGGRRPDRHGRHGHRHHRAEARRGAAPPLGRPARHAARHRPGDPGRALAGRDRPRRAGPDAPDGPLPALHWSLFDFPSGQAQLIAGFSAGSPLPPTPVPLD